LKFISLIVTILLLATSPQTAHAKDNSCPQWEKKMREYKLPVKDFSFIAWRESRCRIKAINAKYDKNGKVIWTLNKNGSIDRGLFQINSFHKDLVKKVCKGDLDLLLTIDCNLKVAKSLYDSYGLKPWVGASKAPEDTDSRHTSSSPSPSR
jgi:hypothetical protein